ncbi:MAG: VIT domain-containing protein, partial [Myxococcota bacterium]
MIRLSLWVLGLSVYAAACGSEPPPPAPTVALATPVRGVVQVTRDDHTVEASSALRIEEGATLTAGDAGPVSIDTDRGAWVLLDRGGAMTLELDALTLDSGRIFVDSGPTESVIETAHGTLSAAEATFAVDVVDGAVEVYCASGELTYRQEEEGGQLAAGETVRLTATEAVAGAAELWDDWTGGLADPTPRPKEKAGFIGVLAGRRFDQLGTARRALPIRGQNVQVRIQGDLAETTVEQTFFNARSEELEGIYSSRIPEGAVVSSFEVDTGAGFRPSHPQVMRTEQYHVPFGPPNLGGSRLAYDGPGRVRARIYPVTPGATIRVRLGYTEWLERRERLRTYVYPMRGDGAPPLIGEFVLQVDASGTPTSGFRAGMGAEVEGTQVTLRRSDFYPTADFYLDLVDVGAAETAKIYQARPAAEDLDDERYVLVDIPTAGFHEDSSEAPLDLVVVVDVSGATENEDLELAR